MTCFIAILLFSTALSFILTNAAFPIRNPVALVLQPAVGVLLATSMECVLILGPCLRDSLTLSPDEFRARMALEKDVERFRQSQAVQSAL